jgi:Ca-activated chloride channel family protein
LAQSRIRPIQLLLVVWTIGTIALAGPAWRLEPSPFAEDDAGLMVVMKVSSTMMADDVQPSRLDRAKLKLQDLLQLRNGSSTGLIVYSGSAHLVMPLTRDDRIISTMLEDLTPDLMPDDGDALADALRMAEQVLQNSGVPGSVLIIADSVAPAQVSLLQDENILPPVQFLFVQSPGAPIDLGLKDAGDNLHAFVARLTADQEDVEELAGRAETNIRSVSADDEGTRWLDSGYSLLPLLALLSLMWSRKGWLLR